MVGDVYIAAGIDRNADGKVETGAGTLPIGATGAAGRARHHSHHAGRRYFTNGVAISIRHVNSAGGGGGYSHGTGKFGGIPQAVGWAFAVRRTGQCGHHGQREIGCSLSGDKTMTWACVPASGK